MSHDPSPPPGGPGACPTGEVLAGLLLGESDIEERRSIADHVVGCASCAADFSLLREMHQEAQRQRSAQRWRRARLWLGAGVTAALVVFGLAPLLVRPPSDGARGVSALTQPADGAVLDAAPVTLSWPPELGARAYRVTLSHGDGSLAWESEAVSEPLTSLPAELRAGMRAGGSWYWTVRVEGAVQRRRLGPFWFQLRDR